MQQEWISGRSRLFRPSQASPLSPIFFLAFTVDFPTLNQQLRTRLRVITARRYFLDTLSIVKKLSRVAAIQTRLILIQDNEDG